MTSRRDAGRGTDGPRLFDLAQAELADAELADAELADAELARAERGAGGREDPRPLRPVYAELIAVAGAGLLLGALLFLKWFGVGGVGGPFAPMKVATGSEGAWQTLTVLRWLVLLTSLVALLPVLVRCAPRWLDPPRRSHSAVAAFGGLTLLLLGYRVLVDLPDPSRVVDQKAGAILGLAGALLIALGGMESMRVTRARTPARRREAAKRRPRVPPQRIARVHA